MTALWGWNDLIAASGGTADGTPTTEITGFSIDTRALEKGEVFVALKDARDGHDFVSAAFKAGAAAALVSKTYARQPDDGALLRVADPLRGLEAIGKAARVRLSDEARVIAVTGSAGKTGTKEMLRACLAPIGPTHAPVKSFNNHWGVPLTLARMPADTKYAVIEIGMNHAGEITPLTKMTRPHIAIITNVLPVHIGNFEDGEIGVANAKAEIFSGLEPQGVAILLRESPHYERLRAAAVERGARVIAFGRHVDADWRADEINTHPDAPTEVRRAFLTYDVGMPGVHIALNSLAVAAALQDLLQSRPGWSDVLKPIAALSPPAGRGARTRREMAGGRFLLIDESYNANPASMRAALATVADVPRDAYPRRLVVLGDMRELGKDAPAMHLGLKDAVDASGADLVFACGEHMRGLFGLISASKQAVWGEKSTDIAGQVAAAIRPGDVVMIKGSLGTNMAPIVAAVRALG